MKIYFYNFFHKGDVFCTRPFLETIISSLKNVDIQFFHQYDDYLLRGLNIEQKSLSEISNIVNYNSCLLYTSPSPRDRQKSRMPSSA